MDAVAIRDLLADIGPIRIRRMFGGLGIFTDDLMFALEAEGELYIKADIETASLFEEAGSSQFSFMRAGGQLFRMSYWRLPDCALDDPSEAALWARRGMEAARRAEAKKQRKVAKKRS